MPSLSRPGRLTALLAGLACAVVVLPPAPSPAATLAEATPAAARVDTVNGKHVIAISVDGLNPRALKKLGRTGTPNLHRLIKDEGAGTVNARTQLEMTVTLPNHTSMVTGRRIKASKGGHGVTWNDDTVQKTVQEAAGEEVASVFTQVDAAGGTTAVYATKSKFSLWQRSWPKAVDKSVVVVEKNGAAAKALRQDLKSGPASFSFLHLGKPDQVGHHHGWMSAKYLRAVAKMDKLVGKVIKRVESIPSLKASTVIVLTADHGGIPGTNNHAMKKNRENYRVPFAIWGAGVEHADLYAINPDRAAPGRKRPGANADPQPIRNGEVANLSLSLLGVKPVPGSGWNADQSLVWHG